MSSFSAMAAEQRLKNSSKFGNNNIPKKSIFRPKPDADQQFSTSKGNILCPEGGTAWGASTVLISPPNTNTAAPNAKTAAPNAKTAAGNAAIARFNNQTVTGASSVGSKSVSSVGSKSASSIGSKSVAANDAAIETAAIVESVAANDAAIETAAIVESVDVVVSKKANVKNCMLKELLIEIRSMYESFSKDEVALHILELSSNFPEYADELQNELKKIMPEYADELQNELKKIMPE